MYKISILFAAFAAAIIIPANAVSAQALYNNAATLNISTGTNVYVFGDFTNATGSTIANAGNLRVRGNIISNATMAAATGGTLTLEGSSAQTLSGTADYFATDVVVNNAAGITLAAKLRADGAVTFTNGIITATTVTAPLAFTAGGSVSGTPTDASHVNGYVVKEGTGNFSYPVGDVSNYQKTDVNLSANGTGLQVRYLATDAGSGTFTPGGTEPTPLASYNTNEYWDIAPLTSATGTVTIYWDGYKDGFSNAASDRRVAHKVGGNWLNEGTVGTGTAAAGSVTSNAISSWSPFTMGSVGSVLPVKWLNVNVVNYQKQALISFTVAENNVRSYLIEKSKNGTEFYTIGTLSSKGNGENMYEYFDAATFNAIQYYRIKQIDKDGKFSYSAIIKLSNNSNTLITIYPNPVKDLSTVMGATIGDKLILTDMSGKVLLQKNVTASTFTIDFSNYNSGVYLLKTNNGIVTKIMKQ